MIPAELTDYIAAIYCEMRQLEKEQMDSSSTYTTPRTLLSILRLSMALAKMRFDTQTVQTCSKAETCGRDGRVVGQMSKCLAAQTCGSEDRPSCT
eukprot:360322-Chlamydomonas_euryale.AAC.3